MFVRNAARTLALALGLVALLAGASSAPAAEEAAAPAKKTVNVNQASASELARLPRVGPSLAGKIVAHREQHGPFKRAEDLMEVKGVGEKMFALLKPYVSVSGPTTLTEKATAKGKGTRSAKSTPKKKAAAAEKAGR
jgi:competence protein ComEA